MTDEISHLKIVRVVNDREAKMVGVTVRVLDGDHAGMRLRQRYTHKPASRARMKHLLLTLDIPIDPAGGFFGSSLIGKRFQAKIRRGQRGLFWVGERPVAGRRPMATDDNHPCHEDDAIIVIRRKSKLHHTQVRRIRRLVARGKTYPEIAREIGVSVRQIGRIARREAWRRLREHPEERRPPTRCPVCAADLGWAIRRFGTDAVAQHVRDVHGNQVELAEEADVGQGAAGDDRLGDLAPVPEELRNPEQGDRGSGNE